MAGSTRIEVGGCCNPFSKCFPVEDGSDFERIFYEYIIFVVTENLNSCKRVVTTSDNLLWKS